MSDNPLKLRQIHHVEFWVGNAKQAAYYYRKAFGFSQFAYSGLETGQRDMASYAMRQGKARLVFRTPLSPDHPSADHLKLHGDGVRDIAFQVDDADKAFEEAVKRGARPAAEPHDEVDAHGRIRRAVDPHLRRHAPLVHRSRRLQRPVPARLRRADRGGRGCRHPAHRPHRRQRRAGADGLLGRLVQRRAGLQAVHQLRRQGHQHRIQRADEHRDVRRQPRHQVPAERAGDGQAQEPDRGVSGLLSWPGRAAHRAADDRHRAHRAAAARQRRRVPERPAEPTTSSCRRASARSTRRST